MKIRQASLGDAAAMLAIYRPIVENTVISFEHEPPSEAAFADRITRALERHDWLVMTEGDEILGYAYGGAHRAREAYAWSVETSVYVHPDHQGAGIGARLYNALIKSLKQRGFHAAFAGIALPNDASLVLHRRTGFEEIGLFREVGWKFGRWHDVSWWRRAL